MPGYRFRRYKIKWSLKRRKVKRRKINRKKSRQAYQNFMRHRAKMLAALRKNRQKIRRKSAKNRNAGMWTKLSRARKRFKHLLKNSLDYSLQNYLFEHVDFEPEIDIEDADLDEIISTLNEIYQIIEYEDEDEEDRKDFEDYINSAKDIIQHIVDHGDVPESDEDEQMVSDILRFIEEFYKIRDEEDEE